VILLLLVILVGVVVPVIVVVLVVVVILVGDVVLLPLGAVDDEVDGVAALEAAQEFLLLTFQNLCIAQNFLASKAISSLGMLSYCSSEAIAREDKTNSKEGEMVLVRLASWLPTLALVIKALLVKEES
jgi:hypothetical protein